MLGRHSNGNYDGTLDLAQKADYAWCGSKVCQIRDAWSTTIEMPQGLIREGSPIAYYFHRDHLSSVVDVSQADGNHLARTMYSPYGQKELLSSDAAYVEYAGMRFHEPSGLYLTYYRAYDPKLGRWLSRDPIGEAGGLNLYGYVGCRPQTDIDPTGECPWCIGALIGFGFDLVTQLASNGGKWRCIDTTQLMLSTALGAVGGGGSGNLLSESIRRKLSNKAKGEIGEALSMANNRLKGSQSVGKQLTIPGQRTRFDSGWDSITGQRYYVESKFETSKLSNAQKMARDSMGDAYRVERWDYPFVERLGAYAGGTAGGSVTPFTRQATGYASDCGCQ